MNYQIQLDKYCKGQAVIGKRTFNKSSESQFRPTQDTQGNPLLNPCLSIDHAEAVSQAIQLHRCQNELPNRSTEHW